MATQTTAPARGASQPRGNAPAPGVGRLSLRRRLTNHAMTIFVTLAFLIALVPLVSLLWTAVSNGLRSFSWEFLTTDMTGVFGDMTSGGARHAIIGTLLITLAATIISVPIGLLAAVYLVEYGRGPLARALTFFVDVMTGIPSIVAGLFAFALFTLLLGPAYRAGIMGAAALAVLMIPVVVRSTEEMLRLVPNELREASYALGVPKWRTIVKVVLRTSLPGIVTGVMLSIARIIGETAPLLLTVGLVTMVNTNLFEGRMATLPVFAYRQYQQGGTGIDRAWAAALTLILIVMALNLIARLISRRFSTASR
ncbi:phosphate ABC transporter, inner membrane subunit PstA [Beutenbergia cavernae DSM 12333]|uniref:Phosphate transport system permease protein PstA n=1 Tax=Beutenbergia cavernae (strain ATCC BAA-8 / DSM 12333 / CCUG 43141 / JCM 11478 / NBRC 16432 / NCIMB 13614 / HKI 0122) TaxID=471853 RepID=C5C241_BEUC1|nr:phosphate ABC transporter, inner membrane subunit PstA [Beutenbergia cavernae DSM 12333]